uniref:Uncharacterized protein n=1 Tax=Glossina pallidipes TaxID=7398 RepID=A0A1A9ZIV7_GLOPL
MNFIMTKNASKGGEDLMRITATFDIYFHKPIHKNCILWMDQVYCQIFSVGDSWKRISHFSMSMLVSTSCFIQLNWKCGYCFEISLYLEGGKKRCKISMCFALYLPLFVLVLVRSIERIGVPVQALLLHRRIVWAKDSKMTCEHSV